MHSPSLIPTDSAALPIDPRRIGDALAAHPATRGWRLEAVPQTGSTNADLMARLRGALHDTAAPPAPQVRLAGVQSAGRGRRGRQWAAPVGTGLLFSIGLTLARPPARLGGLSLVVGAALHAALAAILPDDAGLALKWPNDVLLDRRKLAGILIELAAGDAARSTVVIGIGLNLRAAPAPAEAAHDSAAPHALARAHLSERLPDTAALGDTVLERFLPQLAEALRTFESEGFAPFAASWWQAHAFADRDVVLYENGRPTLQGRAAGVDAQGQLLIDDGTALRPILSGDVSLRPA